MARLKKDHSGWRSSGLHLKYKSPSINERAVKAKSKKDTVRWCGGKVGREHDLYRKFREWRTWDSVIISNYWETICSECGKKFYRKDTTPPLQIPIKQVREVSLPIQVKVDGKPIPIDPHRFYDESYYCYECKEWHY